MALDVNGLVVLGSPARNHQSLSYLSAARREWRAPSAILKLEQNKTPPGFITWRGFFVSLTITPMVNKMMTRIVAEVSWTEEDGQIAYYHSATMEWARILKRRLWRIKGIKADLRRVNW